MTLDEALKELGIEPAAGAEGARRAYLRLLKTRKPEVDREGFMRLREAYELAREVLPQLEMLRVVEVQASGEAELHFVPATAADSATATATASASATATATDSASDSATDSATDSSPPPPPPSSPPPPSLDDLLAAGKFKTAANQLAQRYRDAAKGADIGEDVPSAYTTLRLLLTLHEKNRLFEAKALEKDFSDWLTATGSSARIVVGQLAVLWVVARELSALSKSFPIELRRIIARAALAGDLSLARREASDFRFDNPLLAESAALDLHAHAPSLANMLTAVLTPPATSRQQDSSNGGRLFWVVVPILIAVLRLIGTLGSSSSTPTSYNGGQYLPPPRPKPTPTTQNISDKPPASIWDLVDARAYLPMLDEADRKELLVLVAAISDKAYAAAKPGDAGVAMIDVFTPLVENVRYAIERGDCQDSLGEMKWLVEETQKLPSTSRVAIKPLVTKLDRLLQAACKKASEKRDRDGGASP